MKNITFLLSLLISCACTSAQETRPETDREVVLADYMQAKGQAEIVGLWEILEHEVVWKLGVDAFADKQTGSLEPKTGNIEHRGGGLQWLGVPSNSPGVK